MGALTTGVAGLGSDLVWTMGGGTMGEGAGAGDGALATLVGAGVMGAGTEETEPAEMAPFSRLTSLGGAVLPEKNSPAVSAGSEEGARG